MRLKNTKHFKKFLACLLILVLTFCNAAFMRVDVTAASPKGFYVSGTSVKDANGNDFVMRGINIPHAWFQQYTEMTMEAIANLGCNSVRVVCANGDRWNETTEDELEEIISMCRQNRMVCILEVHDATGKEDLASLEACAKYWISKKDILTKNQDIVIVNIANEWFGSWEGAKWAKGYETVIPMMREGGITNLIMVDCAGWGQYPRCIKDYGKEVFASDPMKNTMFSMHLYEYAGGTADMVKTNLDNALSIGVPVCVGEFGQRHTDGDVDEETILSYCEEKSIGHLAWSWKGNNAPVDFLDLTNTWDGSDLTEWGNRLFNGKNGIKETAKTCTVFGNAPVAPVDPVEDDNSISHKFAPSSPKHHYFTKEQTALLSEENAIIEVTTTTKIEQSGWLNISLVGDSQGKKADVMYKAKAGTKVFSMSAADFYKNELGLSGNVSFENFHVYTWNETVINEINIKTKGTATQPTEEPKTEIPTEIPSETVAPTVDPTVEPTTEVKPTIAPSTEVPSTEVPSTEAPSTEVPSTEVPSTEVPSTEVPSTEAPSTEAPAKSGLKCEYSVNDWGSGFQVLVKIKNTGSKVNGWTLKVSKKDIVFDNSWCVNVKEAGDYYIITPMSWNAALEKGASVDFGIQGGAGGIKNSNIKFELN